MTQSTTPQSGGSTRIGMAALIAVAYFATGKLGLLLAIPPGYATAIWPASGIALGCLLLWGTRYWPAVWLGSLLVNLTTNPTADMAAFAQSAMVAAAIATGAALQAALGAKLLRRWVAAPTTLTRETDILRFFAIAGPLTHLVNATWGSAVLLVAGALPVTALLHTWWTWWTGDTIGALVFTPLMVMWFSGESHWSSRRTVVSISLATTLVAAIVVFWYASRAEWQQLQQRLAEDSTVIVNALSRQVDLTVENLDAVGTLLGTRNQPLEEERFARFMTPTLARHGDLQEVEWLPRVPREARREYESAVGRQLGRAFDISDRERQPVPERDDYYPVQFVAPAKRAINLGFDAGSDASMRAALLRAAQLRVAVSTRPIEVGAAGDSVRGVAIAFPIFSEAAESDRGMPATTDNVPELRGYLQAILSFPQLMDTALRNNALVGMLSVTADDVTDSDSPVPAFTSGPPPPQPTTKSLGNVAHYQVFVPVANRTWRMEFSPTLEYLALRQTATAWLVLAGGLFFTSLMGVGALLITGRAQAIETLVGHRTTELAQINEKLADEICDHLSTEHALEKERKLLKTVINNLYEGIVVLDTAGELQMANGVAFRMLRDITGQDLTEIPVPQPFKIYAPDGVTELLPEQTPHWCALRGQTVNDFEMVVCAPDREPLTLVVNAQPLLTGDNHRHGAIVVLRDITDRKEIERMKAEFVATVSHELRTPITSIRGSLGLIAGGVTGVLPDKTRNLVEIALRNSDRLAHLINDLLDMEKMESGKMQFELQRYTLGALVEQAIEANAGYAQGFNVRLGLQMPVPHIDVTVDSLRLLQVMNNLLSNAVKFSPARSTVQVAVVDRINSAGTRVARVQVTDSGPGIPDEFRSRIFQKFSQADSSDKRAKSGTGLGLAICKAIIEQLQGAIGYETEIGVGTTFYFDLPQAAETTLQSTGT